MHIPDPTFPPLLNGHDVPGTQSAFDAACERAGAGELGAGDVVWSRNFSLVDLAIVLEPEVELGTAVQMLPLSMVAIGDCLGALTPPQVGVTFSWPGVIRVNGGIAGSMKGAASGKRDAASIADWMVIGLRLSHRREDSDPEPGNVPDQTWLSEEGCEELSRTDVIESYARHFLTWMNTWNEDGFRSAHASWLFRSQDQDEEVSVELSGETLSGTMKGLDDNGNLLLGDEDGKVRAAHLVDAFAFPQE